MNILVIGKPLNSLISLITASKHLDKLYTATSEPLDELPNISYRTPEELAFKAKALQTDIAINTDKILADFNITEIFKSNKINLISVNKKWLNLETSRVAAKQLMTHYSINTPAIIKAPLNFPVLLRTKSDNSSETAYSISELVSKMEAKAGKQLYIEEYLDGQNFNLTALWDEKNLYFFDLQETLTEVQEDRLNLLKAKLRFMFSDEKADFLGIFTIFLVWAKNDWYVRDFDMGIDEETIERCSAKLKHDFLYILNSAIYQKLNEIERTDY